MLSNHLGNVLANIGDNKLSVISGAESFIPCFFSSSTSPILKNQILISNFQSPNSSPAPMTERTAVVTPTDVRYGFNGKEVDSEIEGQQDYGLRIYDSRLGRFKSVDPLAKKFPWNSSYAFAEGSPIENIDLDGAERFNYRLSMSNQGEIKMELKSTEDIIEQVIVGYQIISYGIGASKIPIYETQINQRQEFIINGSNASLRTVEELSGSKTPAPIVKAGMEKIKADYAANSGQFSENYNVAFGRFLFEQSFKRVKQSDYVKAALDVWQTVDTETWKNGSTLFFLYENFVRQNDNTGHDKLLHFTASAYYTMKFGPRSSYALGWSKEFFKDFLLGDGWDDNDMRSNQDGINYGETVNNAVEEDTGEFEFCDDTCE
jgi:RHS repeat-associated protein